MERITKYTRSVLRYFTKELIAAVNDWVDQSPAEQKQAEARFHSAVEQYQSQLDHLKSRVSRDAWQFFRYGYGSEGLHDARLLSLQVGDGLKYIADGTEPFRLKSTAYLRDRRIPELRADGTLRL